MKTLLLALALCLSGCGASALQSASVGLDAARNLIAVQCPPGTLNNLERCQNFKLAYNAGIVVYNGAIVADAVHEDPKPYLERLKILLLSLLNAGTATPPVVETLR